VTDYRWDEIRAKAIRQLGETPAGPTEADIIKAFKDNPRHVIAVIEGVTAERASGVVLRSAWAVIRYRTTTSPSEEVIATDQTDRALRSKQAEAWIRNAGVYIDRESELLSELFAEGGMLHPYRTDELEERMAALWHEQRPRGETAEADCERRALERVELRSRLTEAVRTAKPASPEPEADPAWHVRPEPEQETA
jgi:hypothetical protein